MKPVISLCIQFETSLYKFVCSTMEEDMVSSDISAEELAAVRSKGQFARSVSLALSADVDEDAPVPERDAGSYQSSSVRQDAAARSHRVESKAQTSSPKESDEQRSDVGTGATEDADEDSEDASERHDASHSSGSLVSS